ncbi:hypothetical protein ACFPFU_11355 [Negadavirga shengliensis]|uniref:Uncharacterized protein n=1 Tax=Negadavirga shengliensis TaxID=1389218 RepID=A0ABV9T0S1_9BACT
MQINTERLEQTTFRPKEYGVWQKSSVDHTYDWLADFIGSMI